MFILEEQGSRQEEAGGGEKTDISIFFITFLTGFFFILPTVMCLNVFLMYFLALASEG